jgi:hypothetical protein
MRIFLLILISFTALLSNMAGLLMIIDPGTQVLDLPVALLEGTPFRDFLIPGILLVTLVGSINLLAVYFIIQRHPKCYQFAQAAGISFIVGLTGLALLFQSVHWLYFFFFFTGILIILVAYHLKGKWAL